jgi:hypothetical protein
LDAALCAGAVLLALDVSLLAGLWEKAGIATASAAATNIRRLIRTGIIVEQT